MRILRGAPLALALALAGCHRQVAGDVMLDADADARNATAARTLADIAAADAAASAPLPAARPEPALAGTAPPADAGDAADGDAADLNDADTAR